MVLIIPKMAIIINRAREHGGWEIITPQFGIVISFLLHPLLLAYSVHFSVKFN